MKQLQALNSVQIKALAAFFMLVDHIGYLLLPQYRVLRIIGRLAFPLFALMTANAWLHTGNRKRYLLLLALFGLLYEPIYHMCMGRPGNIFFTLLLGSLAIAAFDWLRLRFPHNPLPYLAALLIALAAELVGADYGFYGIGLIFFAYLYFENLPKLALSWLGLNIIYGLQTQVWIQSFSLLALVIFALYNGQRGQGSKWFFYAFYCLHIPLLWGLGTLF